MAGLTAVFGMGTGVAPPLLSPASGASRLNGARPGIPISCACDRFVVGAVKLSTVSTAHLKAFLPLQLRPINLVVFQGSLVPKGDIHTLS